MIDAVFQQILKIEGTGNVDETDAALIDLGIWLEKALFRATPDLETLKADIRKRFPQYAGTDAYGKLLIKELYDRHNLPRLTLFPF